MVTDPGRTCRGGSVAAYISAGSSPMLGSKGLILVGSLNRQSIGGSHTGTGIVLLDISGEATGRGALDRSSEAETYGLGDELGPSVIEDSASGDDKRSTIRQLPLRRGC